MQSYQCAGDVQMRLAARRGAGGCASASCSLEIRARYKAVTGSCDASMENGVGERGEKEWRKDRGL